MAANNSQLGGESKIMFNDQVIVAQVFVVVCLVINLMLIITFCMKDFCYTSMRYILFAVTLLADSLVLLLTDVLLILASGRFTIQTRLCIIICILLSLYTFVTPVTLTAMALERYVAICKPLRHAELCSTRGALHLILLIHGLSSVPCIVFMSIFYSSATREFYTRVKVCSLDIFVMHNWQLHLMSAMSQFYFLVICIIIIFSYTKIMKAAKAASGENKKSTWRGLRTVILHAFQLLLCLIQLWCPFVEAAVFRINPLLYANFRYFNYITFILAPRCLSPLIYGLRDEFIFQGLKHYALCGLYKKPRDSFR